MPCWRVRFGDIVANIRLLILLRGIFVQKGLLVVKSFKKRKKEKLPQCQACARILTNLN